MKGFRAALLRFGAGERLERIDDALVVVDSGTIVEAGEHATLAAQYPRLAVEDWRALVIAPGFVDLHLHFVQLDAIAGPADGLLPWLERYAFPAEARFADPAHAAAQADVFLDELARNGVTSAMVWCSAHLASAQALFEAAARRSVRMVAGKCLMDRNAPDAVRDDTERGLADTETLIRRWHGRGRLGCAITPRFAPSCSPRQLAGAGELARAHPDVWVQTHLAENRDEIAWVARLFPAARSYLAVYDRLGLVRPRAVFAHCLHVDDADRVRLARAGACAAVCPSSNLFLGSGLFDFAAAERAGLAWGLASDVGAGSSFSPLRTMLAAWEVARLRGVTLAPNALWHRHTLGAARAIGLDARIGNVAAGMEADFVALDPRATPLLGRRTAAASSLDEWLFALIALGDDRAVRHAVIAGEPVALPRRRPARQRARRR